MAHLIALASLIPHEAVVDALYRGVIGLDTNDSALFESAWAKDNPCFDRDGTILDGMDAINQNLFEPVSHMDSHHTISNVRVDVKDGADTAYMTTYAIAQHCRRGEATDPTTKGLLAGTMYFIDLVKDGSDGLWKMKKWAMKINWIEGDVSIVAR